MIEQTFNDVYDEGLASGAITNDVHPGFKEDYLILVCLLRAHQPKRFMELGTNVGRGTKIIKNALGPGSEVFSLDLPTELCHLSLQHPVSPNLPDGVGALCNLPFTQLRGDSMTFDYSPYYPLDGWYIDGEHSEENVFCDATKALNSGARIIIFHDCDGVPVLNGILGAKETHSNGEKYEFFRVLPTRIGYLLLK